MKRLIYQVYVGKRSKLYDHCTNSVKEYCRKYGIGHVVQKSPILRIKPDVFATNRSKESHTKNTAGFFPFMRKKMLSPILKITIKYVLSIPISGFVQALLIYLKT